ncbi:hypothetical protein ACFE04_002635 [Oxalis oulophora]
MSQQTSIWRKRQIHCLRFHGRVFMEGLRFKGVWALDIGRLAIMAWVYFHMWQKQDIKRTLKLHYRNFVAPDISEEAAEIQEYIITLESLPKTTMLDLFQRR